MTSSAPSSPDEDRRWQRLEAALVARDLPEALAAADAIDWDAVVKDLQTLPKNRPRRSVFRPFVGNLSAPNQFEPHSKDCRFFIPALLAGLVDRGWNPLEDRAIFEAIEAIPGLVRVLARLCNPSDLRTSTGESLLHLVAQAGIGFPPQAQWFREALSVPTDINAQTARGHTAFHLLWSNGALDNTRREDLAEWNRNNRTLLKAGLDVDIRAQNGLTGRQVFFQALSARAGLREMAPQLEASFEKSYQQARNHRLDQALPAPSATRRGPRF